MRILLVNRALGTLFGGGESFDTNAARYLSARGHDVTLVAGKPLMGIPRHESLNLDIVYLPTPSLRRYAYATAGMHSKISAAFHHADNFIFERMAYCWLKQRNRYRTFDVVQCCSLFALPNLLIKNLALPTVSWLPGPPSGRTRHAIQQLIQQPNFGLFTHGSTVWALDQLGLGENLHYRIIEPGVELGWIERQTFNRRDKRKDLGLNDQDLLGITVSRLVPVKNLTLLLEAIGVARKEGAPWHWLIVGDGPMDAALRQRAVELGIEDLVHFVGHQSQDSVHQWLNSADVFALTSTYESFSIATLEAMAHGLPVIGTSVGYLQHLILKAKAGTVVPAEDTAELSKVLVELSYGTNQREVWGKNGRAFVERLDWPKIAEKLERYYESVALGRAG